MSREHSTAAVGFHFGVPRTILSYRATRPHSENESSSFFGVCKNGTISSKHVHCSIPGTRTCVVFFGGGLRSCPLLYVRTSCVSHHPVSYTRIVSAYLVSYCLLERVSRVTGAQHSSSRLSLWSTSYHNVVACDTSPL